MVFTFKNTCSNERMSMINEVNSLNLQSCEMDLQWKYRHMNWQFGIGVSLDTQAYDKWQNKHLLVFQYYLSSNLTKILI